MSEHICAAVPHCQFVFTIPKRLRIYFRFERRLLGEVCRAAARTVITVYRAASGRPDAVPGMVGAIQTSGRLIPVHPHVHALMAEGGLLARTRCFPAAGQAGHRAVPQARVWTPQRGLPVRENDGEGGGAGGVVGFQVIATLIVEPGVPCRYR